MEVLSERVVARVTANNASHDIARVTERVTVRAADTERVTVRVTVRVGATERVTVRDVGRVAANNVSHEIARVVARVTVSVTANKDNCYILEINIK